VADLVIPVRPNVKTTATIIADPITMLNVFISFLLLLSSSYSLSPLDSFAMTTLVY
jgi:hypothetical protein